MLNLGNFAVSGTIDFKFSTVNTAGEPVTLAGSPAVSVYKANGTTESVAGVTLTVDFDGRTGLHHVRITTSSDATFYATASDFQVVVTAGTVGGVSVVGRVLAHFSIENRFGGSVSVAAGGITTASFASGAINAAAIATDAITAAKIAADAIGSSELAQAAADKVWATATRALTDKTGFATTTADKQTAADELLNRNLAGGGSGNTRNIRNALRFLRNKWAISGTTLSVKEEDDTTEAWSSTVTTSASANPVTGSDPA